MQSGRGLIGMQKLRGKASGLQLEVLGVQNIRKHLSEGIQGRSTSLAQQALAQLEHLLYISQEGSHHYTGMGRGM